MARPIEWRALTVVLLGASVCLGKGRTPIDGTGAAARSGDLAIRGDGAEFGRLAEIPDHGPLLRVEIQRQLDRRDGGAAIRIARYPPLPGRALRSQAEGPADLIVLAGRVWTGDAANPWAEGVAARDGAIVKVGSREDVLRFKHQRTIVIDRPGSFAMPGLIDAHGHVESLGASLERVDLRGVSSLDEVARRVKARIESVPGDSWITGGSWDQSLWPGGAFPTAAVLDAVAPGRPVWLTRVDGHAGWANSEAMLKAGVGRQTMAPADGQILRDLGGQPTGVFVDGAMGLVARVVPPSKPDDLKRRILAAQQQILAAGLTGVHDAGITPAEAQVYRDLDRSGQLRLRVYAMASLPSGHEVEFVSRPPREASPADRFELRAVKVFIDGAMGSRGALLFQPYHDEPASKGLLLIDPKVLEATT
ncbi:MAG: amidohydrolase, partial [Isosphaeraceae bacterium]